MSSDPVFDVAIIGGGINGCGIAADAAMRGLSVILLEKNDIASHTSSKSTKLIHGGLRYLENYQFNMVKKALKERDLLLKIAPHLIKPCSFILPHHKANRPFWLIRLGLFLYDLLGNHQSFKRSQKITRSKQKSYFTPLKKIFSKGLLYSDGITDDARLTIENAIQARRYGAEIKTRTMVISARPDENYWHLTIKNGDKNQTVIAKVLINASGPFTDITNQMLSIKSPYELILVKGSHIIVPPLYKGKQAYVLQHSDGRVIFVRPYDCYTLIGTTDESFTGSPESITISDSEITYLLDIISIYFNKKITKKNIIDAYSGVRPLIKSKARALQKISRDYILYFDKKTAPYLIVYGGKLTTYRALAEQAVDELKTVFPDLSTVKTTNHLLPGASFGNLSYKEYQPYAYKYYNWLPPFLLKRLLSTYGTRIEYILHHCKTLTDLGQDFGHGLFQREVDYLCQEEWAYTADDILNRRTMLGLLFSKEEIHNLNHYLREKYAKTCSNNV